MTSSSSSTSLHAFLPITPILFALPSLRHAHEPQNLPIPTIDTNRTVSQYIDEMVEKLHSHHCVLFDVPTLLYDERWLGTTYVRFHLPLSCSTTTITSLHVFNSILTPILQHVTITRGDGVDSNDIIHMNDIVIDTKQKVDPEPVLKLTDHILFCEPNRLHSLPPSQRYRTHSDASQFDSLLSHELETCERIQAFLVRLIKQHQANSTIPENETKSIGLLRKEKSSFIFHQIERIKQILSDIYRHRQHQIDTIYTCTTCDRILLIHRAIPGFHHTHAHTTQRSHGINNLIQTRLEDMDMKKSVNHAIKKHLDNHSITSSSTSSFSTTSTTTSSASSTSTSSDTSTSTTTS